MTRPRPTLRALTHKDIRLAVRSMLQRHVGDNDKLLSPGGLVFELRLLQQRLEERK